MTAKEKISKAIPFLGFVLLVLFFEIVTKGKLLERKNRMLIFKQGYAVLLASLAGVFVMATGNLDFSLGAIAGFSCVCATLAAAYISPWLSVPVAAGAGLAIGLLNGLMQNKLRLPSFLACLCTMFILIAATQSMITGSSIMMPLSMMSWDSDTVKIVFAVIYIAVTVIMFRYTAIGKQLKAIGVSPEAASQSGAVVPRMMGLAYAITGLAGGIAGFFLMLRTGGAATTTGQTLTTDVIIAIVFGGMSISGGASSKIGAAVLGTLIVTVLNNGMVLAGYGGDAQQLVKGVLFLAIIAVSTRRGENIIIK